MLDFNRQDEVLRETVGADTAQILEASGAAWTDRFWLAREHLIELASETAASPQVSIERDRLASFFGCAYGRDGLLARAALYHALRERMGRLVALAPRLVTDPVGMSRLRRDAVLSHSFARARLSRAKEGTPERALLEAVEGASRTAMGCADFVGAAGALALDHGGFLTPGNLFTLSDLGFVVADTSSQRPLLTLAAFAISRWAHAKEKQHQDGIYDTIVDAHLTALRDALWQAAEAQLASRGAPVPLPALEQADRELEGFVARLSDRSIPGAARAGLIAELFALATAGRAFEARRQAETAHAATLALLADGLAAETGGGA